MIGANAAFYTSTIMILVFAPPPPPGGEIWSHSIEEACLNINAVNIFIAVFHLIFDIYILVLPYDARPVHQSVFRVLYPNLPWFL